MATYYVRPDGNDSNTGLGPSVGQAWLTITKAMGATGITSGDTVYVAPGTYRSATGFTIATAYTSATQMLADPTAAQFSGIPAGPVRLSVFTPTDTSAGTSSTVLSGTTNNLLIQGFEIHGFTGSGINITATANTIIDKCVCFGSTATNTMGIQITPTGTNTSGSKFQIRNCIVLGFFGGININGPYGSPYIYQSVYADLYENLCIGQTGGGAIGVSNVFSTATPTYGAITNIYNNIVIGNNGFGIITCTYASPGMTNIANNLILNCSTGLRGINITYVTATNNRVINCTTTSNQVTFGASNTSNGIPGIDIGQGLLHNLTSLQFGGSYSGSPNTSFGTTGLNASDLFNVAWSGTSPDAGAITYRSLATLTPTYQPTDRQASTITIAPGSTSQSIELYLGATGLTASTSGLTARYNRTRTASVSIPLVARTIAQTWTSGGFAEVDATNMPGVYRLDLPDAALASGADDVTVVVRGASGTNGAVMTVKLSSGGLSSTETAQAVWNATASSYNTAGSMGATGQDKNGYNLASSQTFSTTGSVGSVTGSVGSVTGSVGSVTGAVGSVTGSVGSVTGAVGSVSSAVTVGTNNDKTGYALSSAGNTASADAVWNATRSTHTTAGTFGEYVNAELVTPVSQASLVYMGPFQVIADGVTTPMPLDVQLGAQHGIAIQCVDNNLSAVSISGATVTAKVYNSGGSLVDTYACTATYAADGRATFTIDTTVTGTAGTYTATVTRTTGASDTQVFGPLRIYVRDI